MGRRIPRNWKPTLEMVEQRELLSLITDIMAGNYNALVNSPKVRALLDGVSNPGTTQAASASGQVTTSATVTSKWPSYSDLAIDRPAQEPGFPSPRQPRLQPAASAHRDRDIRRGQATALQGRLSRALYHHAGCLQQSGDAGEHPGAGTNTTMLHSDIQMRLAVATDPTLETTGASAIFDRNINSNSVLGLDLATPRTNVDSGGRPNQITGVTLDVNSSSGVYDESYAQGVIDIHYYPSGKKTPGALDEGTAVVKIYAQIYAPNVDFLLRNTDINP